jgi:hypothetical protein
MIDKQTEFWLLIKSEPHLGDCVEKVVVNLAQHKIELDMMETEKHKVTDWLLSLGEDNRDESITIAYIDADENPRITLALDGLTLSDHHCSLFRDASPSFRPQLRQKITLTFSKVTKLDNQTYTVAPKGAKKKEENGSEESRQA